MSAYSQHYPTLKIRSEDGDFITSTVTLDDHEIPGLVGMRISANLPEGEMYNIELEVLAKLDVEIASSALNEINVKYSYIPESIKEVWNTLPDNKWFKLEDIDFDPLLLEEMVINHLVERKVLEIGRVGYTETTLVISYHKL